MTAAGAGSQGARADGGDLRGDDRALGGVLAKTVTSDRGQHARPPKRADPSPSATTPKTADGRTTRRFWRFKRQSSGIGPSGGAARSSYFGIERASPIAGGRPRRHSPPPAHGWLIVCIPQGCWALSSSGFSFGLLDWQSKPLLQSVGVDALVVAPLRAGSSEEHDPLCREGGENVLHRLDRIALTGIAVSIQSCLVEALDCLLLHQLCPSDRLVGVREPKTQR